MGSPFDVLIEQNKDKIHEKWLTRRLGIFSEQKKSLIMTQMDQFQNPIRHEMAEGLTGILAHFKKGEKILAAPWIKLREFWLFRIFRRPERWVFFMS